MRHWPYCNYYLKTGHSNEYRANMKAYYSPHRIDRVNDMEEVPFFHSQRSPKVSSFRQVNKPHSMRKTNACDCLDVSSGFPSGLQSGKYPPPSHLAKTATDSHIQAPIRP